MEMTDFNKLLAKPIKERRNLTDADIQTLREVDIKKEWWTPGKQANALELMQIALRKSQQLQLSDKFFSQFSERQGREMPTNERI